MLLGTYKKYKIMTEKKDKTVLDVNSISCQELIDVLVQLDEDSQMLAEDEFYDKYTGEIDDEALAAYSEIETKAKAISEEGNAENNAVYNMYKMLKEQLTYGEGLKANGIAPWFINDRGYKLLLNGHSLFKRIVE